MTNGQFRHFNPEHDSGETAWVPDPSERRSLDGESQPVVEVRWPDVAGFAKWLSGQDERRTYRLPTESEWEYACRAGSTTRWYFGNEKGRLDEHAWFGADLQRGTTHDVGLLKPSAWGLYDMHGNVWEWCQDVAGARLSGSGPGVRGGAWNESWGRVRSAARYGLGASSDQATGFRLVSPIPKERE